MTPTGRTLACLRRAGYLADVVERWIPHASIRRDLFGVADVLAVHPVRREFLLIQATTARHVSDRLARARSRPALRSWLQAGGQFQVWGWEKRGRRWHCRRTAVRAEDLAALPITTLPRRKQRAERTLFD